jgi:hypothetical protein
LLTLSPLLKKNRTSKPSVDNTITQKRRNVMQMSALHVVVGISEKRWMHYD